MAEVKVFYDREGKTLTVWFTDREPQLKADMSVLRRDVYTTRRDSLRFVGVGALLGRGASRAKAEASRSNGRKGGRPPVSTGR